MVTAAADRSRGGRVGIQLIRFGSLLLIACGLFALVTGAVTLYLQLDSQLALERAGRAAGEQVRTIIDRIDRIQSRLTDYPVIRAAQADLDAGARHAPRLRTLLREASIDNILTLQLVPMPLDRVLDNDELERDYAMIESIVAAARRGAAEVRVHYPASARESLAFAQRLPEQDGVIFLRLTVSTISSLLKADERLDYVALMAAADGHRLALATLGQAGEYRLGRIPVPESELMLEWGRAVTASPLDLRTAVIVGSSGLLVLMLGLLVRRRTRLASLLQRESTRGPEAGREPAPGPGADTDQTLVVDAAPGAEKPAVSPGAPARPPEDDLPAWLLGEEQTPTPDKAEPHAAGRGSGKDTAPSTAETAAADPAHPKTGQAAQPASNRDGLHIEDGALVGTASGMDHPASARDLGRRIGALARRRGVASLMIGRNREAQTNGLLAGLGEGLASAGLDVLDGGILPWPVLQSAAVRHTDGSALMVGVAGASSGHFSIRIVLDGDLLGRQALERLLQDAEPEAETAAAGVVKQLEAVDAYLSASNRQPRLKQALKVAIDCRGGVCARVVPTVLEALGAECIPMQTDASAADDRTGLNPTDADALSELRLCARSFGADLGLAFDADASRLAAVGPRGEPLLIDQILMLLAAEQLESDGSATVVLDPFFCRALIDFIESKGGRVIRTAPGPTAVQNGIRQSSAPLGATVHGHVFTVGSGHGQYDALAGAIALLRALDRQGTALREHLSQLPGLLASPLHRVVISGADAAGIAHRIGQRSGLERIDSGTPAALCYASTSAGLTIGESVADGSLLLRFEAADPDTLNRLRRRLREAIGQVLPGQSPSF